MPLVLAAKDTYYQPTADDRLWLQRAVEAEGEPRDAVAATLVNGFMWARTELHYAHPLATWVRAYAQPVNPRWFPAGDLFLEHVAQAPEPLREGMRSKAYAREHVHSQRTRFDVRTLQAVAKALSSSPQLPGATDYAAPTLVRQSQWVALTAPQKGLNRFWTRPGAVGWNGYTVITEATTTTNIVLLALAAIGVWLWRRST